MGGRWAGSGRLFEAGRLLPFFAFRMGAYSRLGAYSNKYGYAYGYDMDSFLNNMELYHSTE